MFEFLREGQQSLPAKIIMGTILTLIILSFVFVGVGDYVQSQGKAGYVAKLNGEKISHQEFEEALNQQRDRLRNMLGERYDPAILESSNARKSILDELINRRLLTQEVIRGRYVVSDQDLAARIAAIPEFQEQGQFSGARYEALLRRQKLTPAAFESNLKLDLSVQQLENSVIQTAMLSKTALTEIISLSEQQREISVANFMPQQFLAQATVNPASVKDYYEKNKQQFALPEQVKVEYLVLSIDELMRVTPVSEAEVLKAYQDSKSKYQTAEERRARHILIAVNAKAGAADKNKALVQAERLYKEAKANPTQFADLAKQHSQDTGSAPQGGDLGYVPRGALVPPFEQALFSMNVGEIKGPITTEFGFHIIKLEAIKPVQERPIADVKPEIEAQLKQANARKRFNEMAEPFGNMVYEQSDSLKGVAQALSLELHSGPWLSRKGGELPLLNHPKLLAAIFSAEALKEKRNTEAIEVQPGTLVSARVVDYKPARQRSYEEVATEIERRLRQEAASRLAKEQGKKVLADLTKGASAKLAWGKPQVISRAQTMGLSDNLVKSAFQIKAPTFPTYAGVDSPEGGYTILKLSKIVAPDLKAAGKTQAYEERARGMLARAQFEAYLESLKQQADLEIIKENLEKTEQ